MIYSAKDAVDVPTEKRNVGYVFQSYALWPHMTVLQNVGYPAAHSRPAATPNANSAPAKCSNAWSSAPLADRYPFQLSGGQQQRVAIARSLVYQPRLLLLDEPLSNLDAQLRERARAWLKSVHETFKLTIILVTHDQAEALSLSDHIVLAQQGPDRAAGPGTRHLRAARAPPTPPNSSAAPMSLPGALDDTGKALIAADGTPHRHRRRTRHARHRGRRRHPPAGHPFCRRRRCRDPGTHRRLHPADHVLYLGGVFEITGTDPARRHAHPVPDPARRPRDQTILLPAAPACASIPDPCMQAPSSFETDHDHFASHTHPISTSRSSGIKITSVERRRL